MCDIICVACVGLSVDIPLAVVYNISYEVWPILRSTLANFCGYGLNSNIAHSRFILRCMLGLLLLIDTGLLLYHNKIEIVWDLLF